MSKITVDNAAVAQKKDTEVWISRGYSDHMVVIGKGKSVRFKDYKLVVDTSTPEGKEISDGLKLSGRDGRDIFVVGKPYDDNDIGNRTEMLKMLRDMDLRQLRAMLTLDEMIENKVPANTVDKELLITLILRLKSFGTGSSGK